MYGWYFEDDRKMQVDYWLGSTLELGQVSHDVITGILLLGLRATCPHTRHRACGYICGTYSNDLQVRMVVVTDLTFDVPGNLNP